MMISDSLSLEATVKIVDRGEEVAAELVGEDLGLFIGRHGSTMDAVQYLANIIVYRGLEDRKRIIVDAEEYRERREEVLRSLADRAASEVMKGKGEYEMKPMSAAERRIVHIHLQERKGIETSSDGREPFRRVIITRSSD
jgi:spoIIIJ-associated protein